MNIKEKITNYKPFNEQEQRDKEVLLKYISTFDNLLTRENEIAHFTASNWIVNKERTKVLMAYHNIYKSWSWTGGHADGEENLQKVAIKEAKEETGLTKLKLLSDEIYGIEILPVNAHIKNGKYIVTHMHLDCCYLLEADENEKTRIKQDENSDVKWINIEDATKITNEEMMKPIYDKLNKKLQYI